MRIIQTFWTKNFVNNNFRGGWLSDESNLMCWALSCLNAKKIYGNIELYTDKIGYDILINQFCLPYDKVHIVFDENDFMSSIPKELWALSKVYTYSLQTEPFIHIDGDFIFWNKIDIEKNMLFQNLEIDLDFYQDTYELLSNKKNNLINCSFTQCLDKQFNNNAANLGIFGGYQVSFIKQYATDVLDFIKKNNIHIDLFITESKNMNCFIEQYYLFFLCSENDVNFDTIHPDFFSEPEKNKKMFFNIPSESNSFNHFLGNSKKLEIVNDFVKRKLLEHYPSHYEKIKSHLSNNSFEYFYFNKLNARVDVNLIYESFSNNLLKNKLMLSNELCCDFKNFWEYKLELLCNNNKYETTIFKINENINTFSSDDEFSIKLNDNFISIRKFRLPWDMLFLSDKFYNVEMSINQLNEIAEENLKKPPMYCVFTYTPFESSISSFWLTNLHAYILSRVLTQEFQTISELVLKVQGLLSKNQENSYNKIKSLLLIFLKEIYYYEIIETKNHFDSANATNCVNAINDVAN